MHNYRYNGKEWHGEAELGWLDFGFRYYDPAIGRFPSVDPIADQFAFVSPFNYAENEPVRHIDLWGLQQMLPNPYPIESQTSNIYTVSRGETFYGIADELGVNREAFAQANPQIQNIDHIQPGWELNIPDQTIEEGSLNQDGTNPI